MLLLWSFAAVKLSHLFQTQIETSHLLDQGPGHFKRSPSHCIYSQV